MNETFVSNRVLISIVIILSIAVGYLSFENQRLRSDLEDASEASEIFEEIEKVYDKDIPPETECSETEDGICPQWCLPGSDYDCCVKVGNEWVSGRGCYSK